MKRSKFARDEDGALLVFFALCAAAVFLVASLSFDLGKRASTQTELQSYVDNVALAAAGELNGLPGALDRANRAANELVSDSFVFGSKADDREGRSLSGNSDYTIFFYEALPDDDNTPLTGALEQIAANDSKARFVRVVANDVNVDWDFAKLLTLFSNEALPDEAVNAEAVAGYSSLACDVAPVFFCLPRDPADAANVHPDWSLETVAGPNGTGGSGGKPNIGKTIWLRAGASGGGGGFWEPGNFTWLDVRDQVPPDAWDEDGGVLFNTNHPCKIWANSPNSINMYECLFAAGTGTGCFTDGTLETKPGQSEGNIAAVFNTRFDLYTSSSNNVDTDPIYKPAPSVIKGYVAGDGCTGGGETETDTTMSLPADDCFTGANFNAEASGSGGCLSYDSTVRYGDGDWNDGRIFYVDTNYSITAGHVGTVIELDVTEFDASGNAGELMTINGRLYHKDDPFRPLATASDGLNPGDYMNGTDQKYPKPFASEGFPAVESATTGDGTSTRWDYYRAEVAASLYDTPTDAFKYDTETNRFVYNSGADLLPVDQRLELIQDATGGPGPAFDRLGNSLPMCSTTTNPANYSTDPRRRTLVAAAIDCVEQEVKGNTTNMDAEYYLEVFLLGPSGDSVDPNTGTKNPKTKKDIFVEVISPALGIGGDEILPGIFPDFVQLYK